MTAANLSARRRRALVDYIWKCDRFESKQIFHNLSNVNQKKDFEAFKKSTDFDVINLVTL